MLAKNVFIQRVFAIFSFGRGVEQEYLNDSSHKRVLIKLSRGSPGRGDFGIDPRVLDRMALKLVN